MFPQKILKKNFSSEPEANEEIKFKLPFTIRLQIFHYDSRLPVVQSRNKLIIAII